MSHHKFSIFGRTVSPHDIVPGSGVRDVILQTILEEHSDWCRDLNIYRADLAQFRVKYVHALLESEKGELTEIEQAVIRSLREHELLATNVDAEFEQSPTLGGRLAVAITHIVSTSA